MNVAWIKKVLPFLGGSSAFPAQGANAPRRNGAGAVVSLNLASQLKRGELTTLEQLSDLTARKLIPQRILTATGEAFALDENLQASMALIECQDKKIIAVAVKTHFLSPSFSATIDAADGVKFQIVKKMMATHQLMQEISEFATQNKEYDRRNTSRRPKNVKTVESGARNVFLEVVQKAVQANATDIHFCVRYNHSDIASSMGAVLFRVHGELVVHKNYKSKLLNSIAQIIFSDIRIVDKDSRSESTFNNRLSQNCTIHLGSGNNLVTLRYQHVPVRAGLDVVCRVLPASNDKQLMSLRELGYEDSHLKLITLASQKSTGAVFVAGPTGSGKTTTLRTILCSDPERTKYFKTYSVEDPPEYRMSGVSQIPVQRKDKDDNSAEKSPFAEAMKVLMRMDPDRVMVGEIRDQASGQNIIALVLSGHKVFAATHASSGIATVNRLTADQIGIPLETLCSPEFLSALIFQRLLPVLCPDCKKTAKDVLSSGQLRVIEKVLEIDPEKVFTRNSEGCPKCHSIGSTQLTVCAEVILPSPLMLQYLHEKKFLAAEALWRSERIRKNIAFSDPDCSGKTALEHAFYKMSQGLVDPLRIERDFQPLELYKPFEI